MVKVSASILSANFARLADEIIAINKTTADYIHFDIMDNHFVPNLTFGTDIVAALRDLSSKPFDVHLMVENPENYFIKLKQAGADIITFHAEATNHHDRLLSQIKDLGIKAGLALNPSTPLDILEYVLDKLDLILIMTVNPGFGGQTFLAQQLKKIKTLKEIIQGRAIEVAVDGGVNQQTAANLKQSGADILVAGSFIFHSSNYSSKVKQLKEAK